MDNGTSNPTLYQILQVHPAAPLELITSAYWRLTNLAKSLRDHGVTETALYHLTKAYETLANPAGRAAYDRSIGLGERVATPELPRRKHGLSALFAGQRAASASEDASVDYYELLRIDPNADAAVAKEAYDVMRNYYLRFVTQNRSQEEILDLLDDAYTVIADPEERERYNGARTEKQRGPVVTVVPPLQSVRSVRTVRSTAENRNRQSVPVDEGAPGPLATMKASTATVPGSRAGTKKQPAAATPSANGVSPVAAEAPVPVAEQPMSTAVLPDASADVNDMPVLGQDGGVTGLGLAQTVAARTVNLMRTASQRFRAALDEQSAAREADVAEEEALLSRVSAAPFAPVSTGAGAVVGDAARLTILEGAESGRIFEISGPCFTIGSDSRSDAVLEGVAPQQAQLLCSNGRFALHNTAQNAEIRIHDDSVDWAVLESGDEIQIGPHKLRFESSA